MYKIIKYLRSWLRIFIFKIRFTKRIHFNMKNIKSLYIGKGVQIKISKGNVLNFDRNVYIDDYCRLECAGGNIHIGEETYINMRTNIIALKKICIGKMCIFGPGIGIYDHNHKYANKDIAIKNQGYETETVIIGDDVWLGTNCIITKGVQITDRCIIGANSVVTKNIEKSGVYGGIPCKIIKLLKQN